MKKPYKIYDSTEDNLPCGLNKNIIKTISKYNKESKLFTDYRLDAYNFLIKTKIPQWSLLDLPEINLKNYSYYTTNKFTKNTLTELFNNLEIKLSKEVALDFIMDSKSIFTSKQSVLSKLGIIFCPISEAIQLYPELVYQYLGTVVPKNDNYFAALNSAVFSDGSFVYIPKGVSCPITLSSYFRINNVRNGQFERTLIIAEEGSIVNYVEGCTSPKVKNTQQMHAAVVEIIAKDNSQVYYTTVQNWDKGTSKNSGVLNLVTKRGIAYNNAKISWTQIELGSSITWKYPSVILLGDDSIGEFYSLSYSDTHQQVESGTKMFHLGSRTKSVINSKSIVADNAKNIYRSLVTIAPESKNSISMSRCDSFLISKQSRVANIPTFNCQSSSSSIEHEASISTLSQKSLAYLYMRGFNFDEASKVIISGFYSDMITKLPFEFANETYELISNKINEKLTNMVVD